MSTVVKPILQEAVCPGTSVDHLIIDFNKMCRKVLNQCGPGARLLCPKQYVAKSNVMLYDYNNYYSRQLAIDQQWPSSLDQ